MSSKQIPAIITYHKPGTHPPVHVAGTFSDPPWQPCEMDHTTRPDGEYDFKKEVYGEPGTSIEYKFRVGDLWLLHDDGPTTTDASGNVNHVLMIPEKEEQVGPHEGKAMKNGVADCPRTSDRSDDTTGDGNEQAGTNEGAPSYAQVTAQRIQPPAGDDTPRRDGTGTPISALVAAEVADSAALLHEEVPEQETPESKSGAAGSHKAKPTAVLILEPPVGEGRPFKIQTEDFANGQDEFIADKSPLFAHEDVGLPEQDQEPEQESNKARDTARSGSVASTGSLDPGQVDVNDPTLEPFPSNFDDIVDAVNELESDLPADQAEFDGNQPSPVINPSRRATVDITGDFELTAPPTSSAAPTQDTSTVKSARGSTGSASGEYSLHVISETEEAVVEEEEEEPSFRPIVFSNPIKPEPEQTSVLTRDEDEGVALVDPMSPRTAKPQVSSTASGDSPSLSNVDKVNGAELGKENETKPQPGDQIPQAADEGENKPAPSSAGEEKKDTAATTSPASCPRRLSYAEALASTPPPSTAQDKTMDDQDKKPKPTVTASSSTSNQDATTNGETETTETQQNLVQRAAATKTTAPAAETATQPSQPRDTPGAEEAGQTAAEGEGQEEEGRGGETATRPGAPALMHTIIRFFFVDFLVGMLQRVAEPFGGLFWTGSRVWSWGKGGPVRAPIAPETRGEGERETAAGEREREREGEGEAVGAQG
ncbi:hypothetical protein VTJ49DRAFT_5808 [Mycothermus thermophilus]|uniref:AMP-activated protein kinase glycogen-binding domain-containing protein n=1 Tax=Humicola insolens TaxID=85995 RepID=A0ABR3VQM0_HUMIN